MKTRHQLAALKHYRRRAAVFKSRGLTVRGKRFKRRRNAINQAERLAMQRQRGLTAWNKLVAKRRKAGLTVRGALKVPTRLVGRTERVLLLSEIDALAAELNVAFNELPPLVQVRVLDLANHLSTLRRAAL